MTSTNTLRILTSKYEDLEASQRESDQKRSSQICSLEGQVSAYQSEVKQINEECCHLTAQNRDLIDSVNKREVSCQDTQKRLPLMY